MKHNPNLEREIGAYADAFLAGYPDLSDIDRPLSACGTKLHHATSPWPSAGKAA